MDILEVASVPIIVALTFGVLFVYKIAVNGRETLIRIIPAIALVLGAGLGVLCFYVYPSIMPTDNLLWAIAIGGSSGLAATGANQIFKQFIKGKKDGK